MTDTLELIQGASSEGYTIEQKKSKTHIADLEKVIATHDSGTPRRSGLVLDLFQLEYPQYSKAVWTLEDVRRVMDDYDLHPCYWNDYIGHCSLELEKEISEVMKFARGYEGDCQVICLTDEKNISVKRQVDPFVFLESTPFWREGGGAVEDASRLSRETTTGHINLIQDHLFVLTHKFGPDVTEERKQIVAMRKQQQQSIEEPKKETFGEKFVRLVKNLSDGRVEEV